MLSIMSGVIFVKLSILAICNIRSSSVENQSVVNVLRTQYSQRQDWLEGRMEGMTDEVAYIRLHHSLTMRNCWIWRCLIR